MKLETSDNKEVLSSAATNGPKLIDTPLFRNKWLWIHHEERQRRDSPRPFPTSSRPFQTENTNQRLTPISVVNAACQCSLVVEPLAL